MNKITQSSLFKIKRFKCPLIVRRVAFLLICAFPMSVPAFAQTESVSVSIKDGTVKSLFAQIERQTNYTFVYRNKVLDGKTKVTIDAKDKVLKQVLQEVLEPIDLTFSVNNRTITIVRKPKSDTGHSTSVRRKISGTVVDDKGEPVIGATVMQDGNVGTSTDINGEFSLNADASKPLSISYIGYKKKQVKVGDMSKVSVVLEEEQNVMDEVVVIGYGTQRRRNIVGAVENLNGKEIEDRPNAYLVRSLQGQVPGLNIIMSDGKPSREATLNIRANTQSIGAGGSALCLIDGVEGDLNSVNPQDVESISVLKDASSTAVYGARGAFGVILVTTKRATEGRVKVDYSGSYSIIKETVRPKLMTNSLDWYYDFMEAYDGAKHSLPGGVNNLIKWTQAWEDEFIRRRSDPAGDYPTCEVGDDGVYKYYGTGMNWYDLFRKKTTHAHQHNISVSGANKTASYIVTARYYDNAGMFKVGNERFRQFNVRARGTINLNSWLTLENNTDFMRRNSHDPIVSKTATVGSRIEQQGFPFTQVKNPDGTWTRTAVALGYAAMSEGNSFRDLSGINFKNSTFLTINILKDILVARADYSYVYATSNNDAVLGQTYASEGPDLPLVEYIANTSMSTSYTRQEYHSGNINLTFNPKLGDDHGLTVLAGWNIEHKKIRSVDFSRNGFILNDKFNYDLMTGTDNEIGDAGSLDWGFVGVFGRVNYDYKGKYLVELSGRYDGSSKFPSNERWGFFPSASVGWRMSQERFMKNVSVVDNLKWRFSIGKAGNGNVAPYKFMELLSFPTTGILIDGKQLTMTSAPTNVIPKNITWETASTIDLGLDLNMLDNRLNVTADIYRKDTRDMFVTGYELPAVAGYAAPYGNNADMRTQGIELSLGWQDHFYVGGKPLNYNVRLSFWDSKSKITKYTAKTNKLTTVYETNYYEGMELGELWGYHVLGLFATDEEAMEYGSKYQKKTFWSGDDASWNAGDVKLADLDGSGQVDPGSGTLENHGDLIKIGNTSPRYHYGINLGANWNGIGLSVFFQGIGKRDWYPAGQSGLFWGMYNRPYSAGLPWHADRWTEENPDPNAYWPRLRGHLASTNRGTLRLGNDKYLQNAAYCRLKNITVDYTLPKSVMKKLPVESIRIYLSGENLFFWSPLKKHAKNYDPEGIFAGDADLKQRIGTDGMGYGYPMTKSYTVGLNVSF